MFCQKLSSVIFSPAVRCRNSNLIFSQIRFTHIVKRRTLPPFRRDRINPLIVGPLLRENIINKYRDPADYIYDYVEDTDLRPSKPIKVLLINHVDELGVPGDIVEVDQERARFELILSGLATYASPFNLKKYQNLIEKRDKERIGPSSPFSRVTVKRLEKEVIEVVVSDNVEWTLQKWHVKVALRKAGYNVPDYAIELPKTEISGPDIQGKEGKDFAVTVTINNHEKVPVRCCIHHAGLPLKEHWFRAPRTILLPEEQGELLGSMFVHEKVEEEVEEELFEA